MVAITGFLKDIAGTPIKPTRATIKAVSHIAADGDVILGIEHPLNIQDDGLVMFNVPQGRAELTIELDNDHITLPLVISEGFTLGDALTMGGQIETLTGKQLADLVQHAEKLQQHIDEVADKIDKQATKARQHAAQAAKQAVEESKDLAVADVQIAAQYAETAKVEVQRMRDDITEAINAHTTAASTLGNKLDQAQALTDLMDQYVVTVQGQAESAKGFADVAADVVNDFFDRVKAMLQRVDELEQRIIALEATKE